MANNPLLTQFSHDLDECDAVRTMVTRGNQGLLWTRQVSCSVTM